MIRRASSVRSFFCFYVLSKRDIQLDRECFVFATHDDDHEPATMLDVQLLSGHCLQATLDLNAGNFAVIHLSASSTGAARSFQAKPAQQRPVRAFQRHTQDSRSAAIIQESLAKLRARLRWVPHNYLYNPAEWPHEASQPSSHDAALNLSSAWQSNSFAPKQPRL